MGKLYRRAHVPICSAKPLAPSSLILCFVAKALCSISVQASIQELLT